MGRETPPSNTPLSRETRNEMATFTPKSVTTRLEPTRNIGGRPVHVVDTVTASCTACGHEQRYKVEDLDGTASRQGARSSRGGTSELRQMRGAWRPRRPPAPDDATGAVTPLTLPAVGSNTFRRRLPPYGPRL